MMKTLLFTGLFALVAQTLTWAAHYDQLRVMSPSMGREIPVTVITPDAYAASPELRFPVVYGLHGAGGDNVRYSDPKRPLPALADQYRVIMVFPDGGKTSWWLDSPVDPSYRYETFVAIELLEFIDRTYRTQAKRDHRAIFGGSMGGHGACWIGLRHKDRFCAIGNIFGGLDLRPFPDNWDIKLRLGSIQEFPEHWERYSVINQLNDLKDGELSIATMVGSEDFFLPANREFNSRLQQKGIQHHYIESKGRHNIEFENEAIGVMLRFFHHVFETGKGSLW